MNTKHKSLLFKERSCLGKFKIIPLWIVLHERRINVSGCPQRYVCAALKRKHDSRVSKELAVFRALLKCILSFFQIVSGAIVQGSDEENKMAIKVCLEFITMCCNMSDV